MTEKKTAGKSNQANTQKRWKLLARLVAGFRFTDIDAASFRLHCKGEVAGRD